MRDDGRASLEAYRKNPPDSLGGLKVEKLRDVLESVWKYPGEPKRAEKVDFAKSDVLQFFLSDGTVVSARPSGTEPKIKFYATCCSPLGTAGLEAAKAEVAAKLTAIEKDLRAVIGA
ncbi:hypothetical protein MASR2M78_25660 [Treponema sp.]